MTDIEKIKEMILTENGSWDERNVAISSLLTTIESQKEEIAETSAALLETLERVHDMESEINSLKAITELAVKVLEDVMTGNTTNYIKLARETLSEIERLQNELAT